MEELKLSDVLGGGASSGRKPMGFDLNGLVSAVDSLAKLKASAQQLAPQQAQPQQQIVESAPQVQHKVEKATTELKEQHQQQVQNLESQLKPKIGVEKMNLDKVPLILDFLIEEKGDIKISETVALIDKTLLLVKNLGITADISMLNNAKRGLMFVKTMKGDIPISELKGVLNDLQPFL